MLLALDYLICFTLHYTKEGKFQSWLIRTLMKIRYLQRKRG